MPQDTPWRDKKRLRELYHGQGLSTREIGDQLGCDRKTIDNWMHRYGIELNPGERISKKQQGENNSMYNQVELVCENCGTEFPRPRSSQQRTKRDFCGQECYWQWRRESPAEFTQPPDTQISEQELLAEMRRLEDDLDRAPSYYDILNDGQYSPSTYSKNFGSIPEARAAAGVQKHIPYGKAGVRAKPGAPHQYDDAWRRARKRRLEKDGYECAACGMTRQEHEEKFGTDLHVHHIRPAVEFDDKDEADRMDNLVTLCATHHRKWENVPVIFEVSD